VQGELHMGPCKQNHGEHKMGSSYVTLINRPESNLLHSSHALVGLSPEYIEVWRPYDDDNVYLRRKASSIWALADWTKESSTWALADSWHETWVYHTMFQDYNLTINLRYEELSRVNLYLRSKESSIWALTRQFIDTPVPVSTSSWLMLQFNTYIWYI